MQLHQILSANTGADWKEQLGLQEHCSFAGIRGFETPGKQPQELELFGEKCWARSSQALCRVVQTDAENTIKFEFHSPHPSQNIAGFWDAAALFLFPSWSLALQPLMGQFGFWWFWRLNNGDFSPKAAPRSFWVWQIDTVLGGGKPKPNKAKPNQKSQT